MNTFMKKMFQKKDGQPVETQDDGEELLESLKMMGEAEKAMDLSSFVTHGGEEETETEIAPDVMMRLAEAAEVSTEAAENVAGEEDTDVPTEPGAELLEDSDVPTEPEIELLDESEAPIEAEIPVEEEPLLVPVLDLMVTPNKMAAYLRVSNTDERTEILPDTVFELLKQKGLTTGIFSLAVQDYCEDKKYYKEQLVAKGTEPIKGEDGSIAFHFESSPDHKPQERADGSVDFKELALIQNVSKGDLLCEVIPPKEGLAGQDVYGDPVPAAPGKEAKVSAGKNITISEDGLRFCAATDGSVNYTQNTLSVEDLFHVKKDVGIETGNIIFKGSVLIEGNVAEGFSVEAEKDIVVKGMVEGADLKAGGNVIINGGMNGMKKGSITAGGDVTSRFVENASVLCGGSFYCDCALRAKIKAGNSIVMKGKRAALIGGLYVAGDSVDARDMGSELNLAVEIAIMPEWYAMEVQGKTYEELEGISVDPEDLRIRMENLQRAIDEMSSDVQKVASGKKEMPPEMKSNYMRQVMSRKAEKVTKLNELTQQMDRIEEYKRAHNFSITCRGKAYLGVRITIQNVLLKLETNTERRRFYLDKGEIATGDPLSAPDGQS